MNTEATRHREVIERIVAAQNAHDVDAMTACMAPDYQSEQPVHPDRAFVGSAQVRKNWSAIFNGIPDFSARIVRLAVDGDDVWVEFEWTGTTRAGAPFLSRGPAIFTVRDGKVARGRLYVEPVQDDGGGIDAVARRMVGDA